MSLHEIAKAISKYEKIAILPHLSADGDALGSSLALALALEKLGAGARVYMEEAIPAVYSFLPGAHLAEVYKEDIYEKVQLAVALDTGDETRLGKRIAIFKDALHTVNIDHHPTNTGFAELNYVDNGSSAVGEIIYDLLKILGFELDTETATCLYVAIATDTGGFRFGNTTPLTHQIAAMLISAGVNVAETTHRVFDMTSIEKVRLMGFAAENLVISDNGKIAFIFVSEDMMRKSGALEEDCDGIVNIGRNIRGVEVAVMMRQRSDGEIKVNLRSNTSVDVSEIARVFSGGGHKKAAGFSIYSDCESVKEKLMGEIRKALQ